MVWKQFYATCCRCSYFVSSFQSENAGFLRERCIKLINLLDIFGWFKFECVSLMVHLFINPEVVCGVSSLLNSSKTHWTLKAVWLAWYCKSFLVVWELRINLILNWHVSGNSYRKRLITSVWGLNITDFYLLYICDWGWRDFLHSI